MGKKEVIIGQLANNHHPIGVKAKNYNLTLKLVCGLSGTPSKGNQPKKLAAFCANALNKQIYPSCLKAFWQIYFWNIDIFEAVGLSTLRTLEMNMLVMMFPGCAMLLTKGILQATLVVKHLMNKAFVKECLEGAVNRDAVIRLRHLLLYY